MRNNMYAISITPEAIIKMLYILKQEGKIAKDSLDDSGFLVNSDPVNVYVDDSNNIIYINLKTNIAGIPNTGEGVQLPYRGNYPLTSREIHEDPIKESPPLKTRTFFQKLMNRGK